MVAVCPACGFAPPKGVHPFSSKAQRLHKTTHVAKFPKANVDALDELIHMAERREAVARARVS